MTESVQIWILTSSVLVLSGVVGFFLVRLISKLDDVANAVSDLASSVAAQGVSLDTLETKNNEQDKRLNDHENRIRDNEIALATKK